jgi:tetratricopeptide (TPR) repeat protein
MEPAVMRCSIRKMSMRMDSGVLRYSSLIAVCIVLAYANTFQVPFIFDDQINIVENSSIRNFSSVIQVLSPPFGTGLAGRPIVNFTLALNYAISGEAPWSYHLLNLLIHLSAALCLFGIVRRSLLSEGLKGKYGDTATPLAFCCALLWALHPLQTQAVTYTIQRCESLMGLCFLLTFYFALRGWQSAAPRPWHLAAILSFLVGIGVKEVIVVAPVLLFLYDYVFFHGDPKNAIKRSSLLYAGLAFGLLCLALLVAAGGTASSGTGRIAFSAFDYWVTQPGVILHYLRLSLWPYPLSLDYGWPVAGLREAWPSISIIAVLLIISLWALIKRYPTGYLAAWFFAVLVPTSILPLPDIAFEHRMYLASAPLVLIIVIGIYRLLGLISKRILSDQEKMATFVKKGSLYLFILCSMSLGIQTYLRNLDYQTELSIWADTLEKRPNNIRAQSNVGLAYLHLGNLLNAEKYMRAALNIDPNHAAANTNIGIVLNLQGRYAEAAYHLKKVLIIRPLNSEGYANLGAALLLSGNPREAVTHYTVALRLMPGHVKAHYGLGMALRQLGREAEAVGHFQEALRLNPNFVPAKEIMKQLIKEQNTGQGSS